MFRKESEIKEVHHGFDLRRCENGSLMDLYLEAEMTTGVAYCWWIEIRFTSAEWSIESSLSETEDGQQNTLSNLGRCGSRSLQEFFPSLEMVVNRLTESIREFTSG